MLQNTENMETKKTNQADNQQNKLEFKEEARISLLQICEEKNPTLKLQSFMTASSLLHCNLENHLLKHTIKLQTTALNNSLLLQENLENKLLKSLTLRNTIITNQHSLDNNCIQKLNLKRFTTENLENKLLKRRKIIDIQQDNLVNPQKTHNILSKTSNFSWSSDNLPDFSEEHAIIETKSQDINGGETNEFLQYSFHIEVERTQESVNFSAFIESENVYKLNKHKENETIQAKVKFVNNVSSSLISSGNMKNPKDFIRQLILESAECVVVKDPEFVLKVALYTREELNIRTTANLLLAFAAYNKECRPYLQKYFNKTVRLPSDWIDVAVIYQSFTDKKVPLGTFPVVLRKAMVEKFPMFDSYQLAKYNKNKGKSKPSNLTRSYTEDEDKVKSYADSLKEDNEAYQDYVHSFTLKTLIRRLHISKPAEHVMSLLGKKYPSELMTFYRSGLPGLWDESKSGQRMKLPIPETWETQISLHGNKAAVWEQLIDNKKLPFMAMLRNLRNMIVQGISKEYHDRIIHILTNEKSIAQSRQLPFRFFSAFEVLNSLQTFIGENPAVKREHGKLLPWWEIKKRKVKYDVALLERYHNALNESVHLATMHNLAVIRGRTVIFCDVHWNMDINCRSAKGLGKPRTILEMGLLLALMCQHVCEHSQFVMFGSEKHEVIEHSTEPILSKLKDLLLTTKHSDLNNNSNSDTAFPIGFLHRKLRDYEKIDTVIILTAAKTFPGINEFLLFYRLFVNPDLLFVMIDLSAAKCSVIDQYDGLTDHPNNVMLAGFSEQLLRFIADRGSISQINYIENIDVTYDIQAKHENRTQGLKVAVEEFPSIQPVIRWHSVRIFISSTFRDMHAERDLLIRYVFPELRRAARSLFMEIHEVDMRWGITEEEVLDNKAVEICLCEARKCDIFIGLLGDRYGHIPEVSQIPKGEEFTWIENCHSGASITELEFYGGALLDPNTRRNRSLFCLRDNSFLKDVPQEYLPEFVTETEDAKEKLSELKDTILKSNFMVYNNYPCHWGRIVRKKPTVGGLEPLGEWLLTQLWSILLQMSQSTEIDTIEELDISTETKKHHMFAAQRVESFIPRKHLLELCQQSIGNRESNLIVIKGKPGSGKTSLLSYLYLDLLNKTPLLFIHFIDASSSAASLMKMVQRFCIEMSKHLNINPKITSDYHELISHFSSLLENLKLLNRRVIFIIDGLNDMSSDPSVSWLPEDIPKIVIFIFSMNADTEMCKHLVERGGHIINVSMLVFAERVQMINSMLKPHRKFLSSNLLSNQVNLLASKREAGLPLYLTLACTELRINAIFDQIDDALINMPATVNEMLRMKLDDFCEEYGIHETCLAIGLLSAVGNNLTEEDVYLLFCIDYEQRVLDSEGKQKENLVLSVSHQMPRALFAKLMMDISEFFHFQSHDNTYLLKFPCNEIAAEAWEYCKKKWISNEKKYLHNLLKIFYRQKADPLKNRTWLGSCRKAFSFLVRDSVASGDLEEAVSFLTDMKFLYTKANHGLANEILQDFSLVEQSLEGHYNEGQYEDLFQYKLFLSRNEHFLISSPSLLFQQALNDSCDLAPTKDTLEILKNQDAKCIMAWLNKPDKQRCLRKKCFNQVITCIEASNIGKVFALGTEQGFIIILDQVTFNEKHILRGHSNSISSVCFVGIQKLCSASLDSTLSIWDLELGNRLFILRGHLASVTGCCASADGKLLVSVSLDCSLLTWNIHNGQQISSIKKENRPINCLSIHPQLPLVAIGMWDNTVRIWDLVTIKRKAIFRGHDTSVTTVSYSPCGDYVAAGSLDGKINIWSSLHGFLLLRFSAHSATLNKLLFFSSEVLISVSEDNSVKKWDSLFSKIDDINDSLYGGKISALTVWDDEVFLAVGSNNSEIKKLNIISNSEIFSGCIIASHATAMAACENSFSVGYYSGIVGIFNSKNGNLISTWHEDQSAISFITYFSGNVYISGSVDGILNAYSPSSQNSIKAHTSNVTCIAVHPWKPFLSTVSKDKVIKIWTTDETRLKLTGVRDSFHNDWVTCCTLHFKTGQDMLITGSNDSSIKIWNITKNFTCIEEQLVIQSSLTSINILNSTETYILAGSTNEIKCFTFNGETIMMTEVPKTTKLCPFQHTSKNTHEGDWYEASEAHEKENSSTPYKWTSTEYVAVAEDARLMIISIFPTAQEERISGHSKSILGLCKVDEKCIATSSKDHSVCFFDLSIKQKQITGHASEITAIAWNSLLKQIVTGSRDGNFTLWNWNDSLLSPQKCLSHKAHTKSISAVNCSMPFASLLTGSRDCHIKLWKIDGKNIQQTSSLNLKIPITCMDAIASDNLLIAGGWWGSVWLCSLDKLAVLHYISINPTTWILQVKFSPEMKNTVFIMDNSCNFTVAHIGDKNPKQLQVSHSSHQDIGDGYVRSLSQVHHEDNSLKFYVNSSHGIVASSTFNETEFSSSTCYQVYDNVVLASEYSFALDILLTSSDDSLLKVWKINETIKQVGQFECSSPVTMIKVVNGFTSKMKPLIVCGDAQGNVYFLNWL